MIAPANLSEYAQPYERYFYQFEDDGEYINEVVSIPGGRTICYTHFLIETLESLAHRGAPPLGTLLLAIIATSGDAKNMLTDAAAIIERTGIGKPEQKEVPYLSTAMKFLDVLSSLPAAYRQGTRRLQVLHTIFLDAHNMIAERRIKGFTSEYRDEGNTLVTLPHAKLSPGILNRDLRPLAQLHYKFGDVDALLARLADVPQITELPFEPEPQLTEQAAPKDFIEELEQHTDTFHAASLVRRIWSGLQIPFHSNHPSAQPLGGVADLTNRGELDKLLLSEHANDELLFLSRLANGEALYINRETPPETSKLRRILLIDSSLQAWGTPRTLSYALLLAIAHHPKTDIDCAAFAVGERYETITITTIHDIIDSLQLLDTGLNAAPGLEAFFRTAMPKGRQEVMFLTSPQGMKQPAVQKILAERNAEISYCITASDEGECTVYKKSGNGLRQLQSFLLPLSELWKNPPKDKGPGPRTEPVTDLPSGYPILFPGSRSIRHLLTTQDGQVLAITTEKSVLQSTAKNGEYHLRGWKHLIDRLPAGHCTYETGMTHAGHLLLLCYVFDKRELHLFNLSTDARASLVLDTAQVQKRQPPFLFTDDSFTLLSRAGSGGLKFTLAEVYGAASVSMEHVAPDKALEESMLARFAERQEALRKIKGPTVNFAGVLKHLKRAFINDSGLLVINSHCLNLDHERFIRLAANPGGLPQIEARLTSKGNMVFPDRSTITINPNGMLILKSSGGELPDIYIPAVLETTLGVSTKAHFAGRDFFSPGAMPPDKILEPAQFYRRYIQAFIDHITQHAAPDKSPR